MEVEPKGFANFAALCDRIYDTVNRKSKVEIRLGKTPIHHKVINKLAPSKNHAVVMITVYEPGREKDPIYLSFEKSYYGILAQFSQHEENLIFLSNNELRRKELTNTTNWENLERLMHISHLDEVLEHFGRCQDNPKYNPKYSLLKSNCIDFADSFAEKAKECDSAITFKMPGLSENVTLRDERVVEYYGKRYPNRHELGAVSYLPEQAGLRFQQNVAVILDEEAYSTTQPLNRSFNVGGRQCVVMDDVFNASNVSNVENEIKVTESKMQTLLIHQITEQMKEKGSAIVIPYLHEKESLRDAMEPAFSFKWHKLLKNIILSKNHGLLWIFESRHLLNELLQRRLKRGRDLLLQVYKIAGISEAQLPISIVTLKSTCHERSNKISFTELIDAETFQPSIWYWFITNEKQLSENVRQLLEACENRCNSNDMRGSIDQFASVLMVIHHLEDNFMTTHQWRSEQSMDRTFIMLTLEQAKIIEKTVKLIKDKEAKEAAEFVRLLIKGCPGSGKTLILMQISMRYLQSHPDKKVVFRAFRKFSELKASVKQRMETPGGKQFLIDAPNTAQEWESVGLVVIDEYEATNKRMADGKFLIDVCGKDVHVVVCSCKTQINSNILNGILPSEVKEKSSFNEEDHPLFSDDRCYDLNSNLRSPPEVVKFCNGLQKIIQDEAPEIDGDLIQGEESDTSQTGLNENSVVLKKWSDHSRNTFIAEAAKQIDLEMEDEKNFGMVCRLSHALVGGRIKDQITSPNKSRWKFLGVRQALGCQYPVVVVVLDLACASINLVRLIESATRATVRLVILWNDSTMPYIGERLHNIIFQFLE